MFYVYSIKILKLKEGNCPLGPPVDLPVNLAANYQQKLTLFAPLQVTDYTKQIEDFIKTANEGLAKEEPSSDDILRLLEDSTAFDLDLPQIPLLHQVIN